MSTVSTGQAYPLQDQLVEETIDLPDPGELISGTRQRFRGTVFAGIVPTGPRNVGLGGVIGQPDHVWGLGSVRVHRSPSVA